VILLALYSTAGIALIVIAVSLLSGSLGGSDEREPNTLEPVATIVARRRSRRPRRRPSRP
jgi:hypothetical protein